MKFWVKKYLNTKMFGHNVLLNCRSARFVEPNLKKLTFFRTN
jgi:hypothetical protein